MDINTFFNTVLFSIGEISITVGAISTFIAVALLLFFLFRLLSKRLIPAFFRHQEIDLSLEKEIKRLLRTFFILALIVSAIYSFGFNFELIARGNFVLRLTTLFLALLLLQGARIINWLFSKIFLPKFYNKNQEQKSTTKQEINTDETPEIAIQNIVYIIAALLIIYNFNLDFQFYDFGTEQQSQPVRISNVLYAILILLISRIFSWAFIQIFLSNYYDRNKVNVGAQYAINQLLKYVVFIIAILMGLQALNINLTLLLAGSATILLGIGLGLQQTFNDLISGIILLFERTIEVGDMVEVDHELVGEVRAIGWRTSEIETRDAITVVVPNSKLMSDNVINWSHSGDRARFSVGVGVAYGSDTDQVKQILLKVAKEHNLILTYPAPKVRFIEFGDSSLNFELHFWSRNFMIIEDIKSDLRFEIDKAFRENNIEIPFPQRDVWFKNSLSKATDPTTA